VRSQHPPTDGGDECALRKGRLRGCVLRHVEKGSGSFKYYAIKYVWSAGRGRRARSATEAATRFGLQDTGHHGVRADRDAWQNVRSPSHRSIEITSRNGDAKAEVPDFVGIGAHELTR